MISRRVFFAVLVFALGMSWSSIFPTQQAFGAIRIDINSPGLTKYPIAVPEFKTASKSVEESDLARSLPEELTHDLDYTGYFRVLKPEASLQDVSLTGITKKDIQFRAWSIMGAEMLVTGGIRVMGRELELELRLFDVIRGERLLGKKYTGDLNTAELMIHRFGNEMISLLTGFKGYFGSRIAFVRGTGRTKEIYQMNFDGRKPRPLTNYGSLSLTPRWSPDGNWLAFISYKEGTPEIFLRSMSSDLLKRISLRKGLNISPAWAPDGRRLAVTVTDKGRENIFLVDMDGNVEGAVTDRWGINVSATWSPDGDDIAFVSNRAGKPQIYVKNLKNNDTRLLTLEGKQNLDPAWSPRGDRIAFVRNVDGDFHIFTMNPKGEDVQRLTYSGGLNLSPAWSPDGTMIAFSSDRDGELAIYVMNANGVNQRRLTFMKGTQESPSWSSVGF